MIALVGLPASVAAVEAVPRARLRARSTLCDVAAGGLDGYVDAGRYHAPWDYLGGYLACIEAGAVVRDANGDELVTDDPDARRQLVAAGTPELADALMAAVA